jgi:hypothetical protein
MLEQSLFVEELKALDTADNLVETVQVHQHFVNNLKQLVQCHLVEYI